jgi:cobalt-zinc-cadmium efflux system protein
LASYHHHHSHLNRVFALGTALNIAFVILEVLFGFLSGSLALLSDAGHNTIDVLGLLLAWGTIALGKRRPTRKRTYGWQSSTIMAALLNSLILLGVVGGIAWEAITRFSQPVAVAGRTVIWVALCGVAINTLTALLFLSGRRHDLNVRGAFLHMAADAGVSAGVVVAGVLVITTGRLWIDPLVSLAIAAVILYSTWGLLRESLNMALHAVPGAIDTRAIETYLLQRPGITAIHDLHVWAMSTTETALTAHLVKPNVADDDALILSITRDLQKHFGITHVTLQLERRADLQNCGSTCYTSDTRQSCK